MGYSVYMGALRLPVTPGKMAMAIKNRNKTTVLINDGEINTLKRAGLTDISFTALLPQTAYPFAHYQDEYAGAEVYLEYFEKLKAEGKPFRFIVSRVSPAGRLLFDTNMLVSLEDYRISEDAREGFDLLVDISLKQYREHGTREIFLDVLKEERPADNEAPGAGTGKVGVVTLRDRNSHLNVRKRPSSSSKILGKLKQGATVTILGKTGSWYIIPYASGDDGKAYVYSSYIRTEAAGTGPGSATGKKPPKKQGSGASKPAYNNGSLNMAQVRALQKYLGVSADGKYGSATAAAAKKRWGSAASSPSRAWSCYQGEKRSAHASRTKPTGRPAHTMIMMQR